MLEGSILGCLQCSCSAQSVSGASYRFCLVQWARRGCRQVLYKLQLQRTKNGSSDSFLFRIQSELAWALFQHIGNFHSFNVHLKARTVFNDWFMWNPNDIPTKTAQQKQRDNMCFNPDSISYELEQKTLSTNVSKRFYLIFVFYSLALLYLAMANKELYSSD